MTQRVTDTIDYLMNSNPAHADFYQAAKEVLVSLQPLLDRDAKYQEANIIQRIVEPERQILFRVAWVDDHGTVQVTRATASSSTSPSARTRVHVRALQAHRPHDRRAGR